MILLKSTLAGVAALITAALATYGLAAGVPHILKLMPNREGFKMLRRSARSWDKRFLIVVGRIPGRFTSSIGLHET